MLGLQASGRIELIQSMVSNFSHLIDTIGYIPNGNRTYYLGRSQPPFYSLMVGLLAGVSGSETLPKYLDQLEKEYSFWMKGAQGLDEKNPSAHHSVRLPDGEILNRYWDENTTPKAGIVSGRRGIGPSIESATPNLVPSYPRRG